MKEYKVWVQAVTSPGSGLNNPERKYQVSASSLPVAFKRATEWFMREVGKGKLKRNIVYYRVRGSLDDGTPVGKFPA